jgi:hypothetical protein
MANTKKRNSLPVIAWNTSFYVSVSISSGVSGFHDSNKDFKMQLIGHRFKYTCKLVSTSEVFGEQWDYKILVDGLKLAALVYYIAAELSHPIPAAGWQRIPGYKSFEEQQREMFMRLGINYPNGGFKLSE